MSSTISKICNGLQRPEIRGNYSDTVHLPVHNRIYSQPQRPNDVTWNTANCRNRRIFDDRAGLSAARNAQAHLIQSYPRDMGNGVIIMMREIDAPIRVFGKHWGGFRTAYKMA